MCEDSQRLCVHYIDVCVFSTMLGCLVWLPTVREGANCNVHFVCERRKQMVS